MTWNLAFQIMNVSVMPAWALLILLPRFGLTRWLVHSALYPVVFGVVYLALLIASIFFGYSAEGVGYSSIDAVAALFDHPNGVLTGWSHYLVFDLFVGAWIGRDALRNNINHIAVIPCFLLTYLFGPVGLLLYALLRALSGRGLSLNET